MEQDQTLEISQSIVDQDNRERGERFSDMMRKRAINPENINSWKANIPGNLPSDEDYDYTAMFSDGVVPQKTTDDEPVFLPSKYYKGKLKTHYREDESKPSALRQSYNINSGRMEYTSGIDRAVIGGVEKFMSSLVGVAYEVGTATAFPVDVAAESISQVGGKVKEKVDDLFADRPLQLSMVQDEIESAYAEGGIEAVNKFYSSPIEVARNKLFQRWSAPRPKIGNVETYGLGEDMASMMIALVGDFAIGSKMAGANKISIDPTKLQKFTNAMIHNLKINTYGEYLFSTVDEEGGNISSAGVELADYMGFDNAFVDGLKKMDSRGEDQASRIFLNTAEITMLGSIWQFAKIAKDPVLAKLAEARLGVVKDRFQMLLEGGSASGSPAAQRGSIGVEKIDRSRDKNGRFAKEGK